MGQDISLGMVKIRGDGPAKIREAVQFIAGISVFGKTVISSVYQTNATHGKHHDQKDLDSANHGDMMDMSELRCGVRSVNPGFVFMDQLSVVSDTRKGRGLHRKPRRATDIFIWPVRPEGRYLWEL